MTKDTLYKLCETLGKPVDNVDVWKNIKYVHTPGQASPAFDVEKLLKQDKIEFIDDPSIGEGFFIDHAQSPDMSMDLLNHNEVSTFFDLEHISELSLQLEDDIVDIYDVVRKVDSSIKYKVNIFFQPSINKIEKRKSTDVDTYSFKKNNGNYNINIPILFSRKVSESNYTITKKNLSTGNNVDNITEAGSYSLTVTMTGDYEGKATCYIICE